MFDLSEMIRDRKHFIQQLNGQFGGAKVNELISMQIDEFKVRPDMIAEQSGEINS